MKKNSGMRMRGKEEGRETQRKRNIRKQIVVHHHHHHHHHNQ